MKDDEDIIYLGAGPGAAILLGAALVPFREATSASMACARARTICVRF